MTEAPPNEDVPEATNDNEFVFVPLINRII